MSSFATNTNSNSIKIMDENDIYNPHSFSSTIKDLWNRIDLFNSLNAINQENDGAQFNFIDGPPFVSGKLHLGHAGIFSQKSTVTNWNQVMNGYVVPMKLGYDCHGLPVEDKITKLYDVKDMPLEEFNAKCDEFVTSVSDSWTPLYKEIGRYVDFGNNYMTRDINFMESCWWVFSEIFKKGLVYMGKKVMPFSYGLQTSLSNFEAAQNYREVENVSVYVRFPVVEMSDELSNLVEAIGNIDNINFIAWTTTPWTLVSNLALCVNNGIDYVIVVYEGYHVIVSKNCLVKLFGKKASKKVEILAEFKGDILVGTSYEPITTHMSNIITTNGLDLSNYHRVFSDNYVTDDGGTGIVHMAPAFGADDYRVCESNGIVMTTNIELFCPVDETGSYTNDVPEFEGRLVFEASDEIRVYLKDNIVKSQNIKHTYPHCYRTDTPLIYMAVPSWYIKVEALKDRMVELNETVTWYPEKIGTGRFGTWIANAKDWAVSRNRMYGTPLPIWANIEDENDVIVVQSIDDLYEKSGVRVDNLHPQFVNDIEIVIDDKTYKRVPYIFDCWFESGCVPFGQIHYPFAEGSEEIENREFLCDYVCEGLDQTRGWFYTLLVISTAILDKAPVREIQCTGLVMDSNGNKFSKKLGNGVDPTELIKKYGADAVRMYLIGSPLTNADFLYFDEENLKSMRSRLVPYHNSVVFVAMHTLRYSKNVGITGPVYYSAYTRYDELTNITDKWILNVTAKMVETVSMHMSNYYSSAALLVLFDYVDELANWYLKLNRNRMKGIMGDAESFDSLNVLYTCIMTFTRLMSSFAPFMSENIFQHIKGASHEFMEYDSIFFIREKSRGIPDMSDFVYDSMTMDVFSDIQKICVMIRNVRSRSENHRSRRVPFMKCTVGTTRDTEHMEVLRDNIHIIKNEANYFDIEFKSIDNDFVYEIVPNRREIGSTFRKNASKVMSTIQSMGQEDIKVMYDNGFFVVDIDGNETNIDSTYYDIVRKPNVSDSPSSAVDGDLTIEVDVEYTEKVHYWFNMRSIVSHISDMRKRMGLISKHNVTILIDSNLEVITENYGNDTIVEDLLSNLINSTIRIGTFDDESHANYPDDSIVELENGKCMCSPYVWTDMIGTEDNTNKTVYVNVYINKREYE